MLNPHYVVGFVDGEGCFSVSIGQKRFRIPEIKLKFEIEVREDDEPILQRIKELLDCGYIYRLKYERYKKWRPHVKYVVGSLRDLTAKVIPFFKAYPLQAKKSKQFDFFCQVAEMMGQGEHKTLEGIAKISSMRDAFRHRDSLDALEAHV